MALGIMLSLLNHCEFRDRRAIWFHPNASNPNPNPNPNPTLTLTLTRFQFVPELTFFLSIFGIAG